MASKKEQKESRQSQLQRESNERISKFAIIADTIARIWDKTVWGVIFSIGFYFLYLSIRELAGRETLVWVKAQVSDIINIDGFKIISGYLLATGFYLLYHFEKKARKLEIKKNANQISEMQKLVDQKRTGSGLNSTGENPNGEY